LDVTAETALEVQSWCRDIITAKPGANHTFSFRPTHETGFCWGSFGAIQELSLAAQEDGTRLLGICLPADSDRLQLINIFSAYVDDHPEIAHQGFAHVAGQALIDAFSCVRPPDIGVRPTEGENINERGRIVRLACRDEKKPETGRAITLPRVHSAIRSPPQLGRSAASIARRDGVEG
jgi:hypothetical protein